MSSKHTKQCWLVRGGRGEWSDVGAICCEMEGHLMGDYVRAI